MNSSQASGELTLPQTATVGQVLMVADTLMDADGIGPRTYTWETSSGYTLTGETYTVIGNDVGRKIRVVATYTDLLGNKESVTSNATESIGRTMDGTQEQDNLVGTLGSDIFRAGTGNDTVDGGRNDTTDTAIFSGKKAGYRISYLNDKLVVSDSDPSDGDDGTDLLTSIECLEFSDGVTEITYPRWYVNETLYVKKSVSPTILSYGEGRYLVGWVTSDNALCIQRFDAADSLLGDADYFKGNSYYSQVTSFAAVTLIDKGYVLAYSSNNNAITIQRFDADGIATTNQFRGNTSSFGFTSDGYGPAIAGLKDGGYILAWTGSNDTDGWGIFAQRFDSNNLALGNEFVVNTNRAYNQQKPQVVGLDNGNFVVVWESNASNGYSDIRFQIFGLSNIRLGNEVDATESFQFKYGPTAGTPLIVALSGGRFALAWDGPTTNSNSGGIYFSIFDAAGVRVGKETYVGQGSLSYMTATSASTFELGYRSNFYTQINNLIRVDTDSILSEYSGSAITGFQSSQSVVGSIASGLRLAYENSETNTNFGHLLVGTNVNVATILGTVDSETILLSGSNIKARGLQGDDTYVISVHGAILEEVDGGTDSVFSTVSYGLPANVENLTLIDQAASGSGNELSNLIIGTEGDNSLSGKSGNDTIDAGVGNDWIEGGLGDDDLSGGDGVDVVVYQSATGHVSVDLSKGTAIGSDGVDTIRSFENISGSAFSDELLGDEKANYIYGGGGDDTIIGGSGDDTLEGGTGANTYVYALSGNGEDRIFDSLDYGCVIRIAGAVLTGQVVTGQGMDTTLFRVEADIDSSRMLPTTLYIGTDAHNGADVVIHLGATIRIQDLGVDGETIYRKNYQASGWTSITGVAAQGSTLVAGHGIIDQDGIGQMSYVWHASGITEPIATGDTFTPGQTHVGRTITVTATYVDGHGTTETVISTATSPINNSDDPPDGEVRITGTVTEGQTISVDDSAVSDLDGDIINRVYQWQSSNDSATWTDIAGATDTNYTVDARQRDTGLYLRAKLGTTDVTGQTGELFSAPTPVQASSYLSVKATHWRPDHAPLADVRLALGSLTGYTDQEGLFTGGGFEQANAGTTGLLELHPTLTTTESAAISLADVLATLKVYLGKPLDPAYDTPYKFIAADFDGNGQIALLDVLGLLKYYLKKAGAGLPSWAFVDSSQTVTIDGKELPLSNQAGQPLDKGFAKPGTIDIDVGIDNDVHLIGILRGDMDGSWMPTQS